jgi:flavorubredoxin
MSYSVAAFLQHLKASKLKGKKGLSFGAYGWFPRVAGTLEQIMTEAGLESAHEAIKQNFQPSDNDLENAYNIATEIAKAL